MSLNTAVNLAQSFGDWINAPEPFPRLQSTLSSPRQNRRNTITALPSSSTMSDRGYGYPQPPRSPVMRAAHPARSSGGSLSSRDPYYDYSYSNPRSSGERLPALPPRSDPRQFDRPLPYRTTTRDDYDVAPRRLTLEPRYDTRPRAGSAIGQDRRPLSIVPPSTAERDRVRPQVSSAGLERPRGSDRRDDYYVVPASSTRTGHGRHLSADVDDRGRYNTTYTRPAPQYADSTRDGGRYYGPEPGRRSDEGLARRAYDNASRSAHLYPETSGRPRAGSDVGARERPNFNTQEYVRERPRAGPPPSTRGFDKLGRNITKQIYHVPRDDTMSSTSSRDSAYRNNTGPHEKRHAHDRPITLHQGDVEYGYSSAEERGGPGRDKLAPVHHKRRDESRDRTVDRERRYTEDRYSSDTDRQRHKHHRDRSARTDPEKHHRRDESDDRHGASHRHRREDSEDRYASTRVDEDSHRHKSRRDDEREDEDRRRRRHEERDRERDRDRDRDRDREKDKDKDKDRSDDKNRRIAETLGLGGAGAALVGLARDAIKKRTGQYTGEQPEEEQERDRERDKDRDKSDRYGDDGLRKRKKDETPEERRERHRLRRENETEEERQDRHRKRHERRDRRDREDEQNGDGGEQSRGRLEAGAGAAAAAAGAASLGVPAPAENREKSRERSRARFEDDDKEKDRDGQQRRRRRRKQHTSESDTSSSSESDVDRKPPMRSRANSAARPAPTKGILKNPTPKFPENHEAIREGVAPLKDAKGQKGIPPTARWTKIDRRLVNPAALAEAQERFEERTDHVIVLRVLTREDIEKYARRTNEIREERHKHEPESNPADKANYDRMLAMEAEEQRRMDAEGDRPPLAIEAAPHNADSSMDNIVRQAAANNQSSRSSPYTSRNNSPPQGSGGGASPMPAHPAYAAPPQQQTWEAQNRSQQSLPTYGRDVVQSPDSMNVPGGFPNGNGGLAAAMHEPSGGRSRSGSGGSGGSRNGSGGFKDGASLKAAPAMAGAQPAGQENGR